MIKTLLVAGLLSTTVLAGHANADLAECGVNHSRMNPVELSDYQECWLDEFRGDDTSGVLGSLFWVNINDKYYSAAISTLRWDLGEAFKQSIVDDQISMAQIAALKEAIASVNERLDIAEDIKEVVIENSDDLEKLKRDLDQANAVISKLEAEKMTLEAMLTAAELSEMELMTQIAEMSKQAEADGMMIADLQSTISDLEDEVAALQMNLDSAPSAEELEAAKKQIAELQDEVAQLEKEIEEIKASDYYFENGAAFEAEAFAHISGDLEVVDTNIIYAGDTVLFDAQEIYDAGFDFAKAMYDDGVTQADVDAVEYDITINGSPYTVTKTSDKTITVASTDDGVTQADVDAVEYDITINGESHTITKTSDKAFTIATGNFANTSALTNDEIAALQAVVADDGVTQADVDAVTYDITINSVTHTISKTSDKAFTVSTGSSAITSDDISAQVMGDDVYVTVTQDGASVQKIIAHGLEAAGSYQSGVDSVTVTGHDGLTGNELAITLSSGKANQKINIGGFLATANSDGSTADGLASAVTQANAVDGLSAVLSGSTITYTIADAVTIPELTDAAIQTALDAIDAADKDGGWDDGYKVGYEDGYIAAGGTKAASGPVFGDLFD